MKDLKDKKFGRLKVTNFFDIRNTRAQWVCKCSCGKVTVVDGSHLRSGMTKSCGCLHRERAAKRMRLYTSSEKHLGKGNPNFKHGSSHSPLYAVWAGIKSRCNTKTAGSYSIYGGRGIKCEWTDFPSFRKDMERSYVKHVALFGRRNTTIDRINPNKNYNKSNCRWATWNTQSLNRWKWIKKNENNA